MKWFETSPYGISFKVRVNDRGNYKYMAINLIDNGRIDYKIQWKEEDMCTIDDINKTYKYINLSKKVSNNTHDLSTLKDKITSLENNLKDTKVSLLDKATM